MPTVLILGGVDDEHALHVLTQVQARGVDAELLDSRAFPTELQLGLDPSQERWTLRLPGGRQLVGEEIRSVYWRAYHSVQPPALPDPEQTFISGNDARSLFESLLIHLPARWVNGWAGYQMHQTKPVALARVARLGMPIPATMLTNDPVKVREFVARHPRCIFKPVQGGAHTRRITSAHLTDENLKSLAYAPVTLQEEVPGTNIRVFVAGERVQACEVQAESIDFRDNPNPMIVKHDLPTDMADLCRRAATALHLLWSGIDLRLTPEGRYVFLEANPSPMFLGFESRCDLPLTEMLVQLLLATQP